MKVSVIIPVYNAEKYLAECIRSVLNQTLKDIEVICVDDGSTDASLNILYEIAKEDERLIVLTQQNQFAGMARNKGIEIAKGEYLVFLDADDFFENDMLECQYQRCVSTGAQICVCDADNYDVTMKKYYYTGYILKNAIPPMEVFSRKELGVNTFLFCYPAPWNKMFQRKLVEENLLRFQNVKKTNDLAFVYLAIACAERITTVDRILVHYRVGMQTSLQARNKGMDLYFAKALEYLNHRLKEHRVYEDVKASYSNLVMRTFIYEYKRQIKGEYVQMYDWFFKEGAKNLELSSKLLLPQNAKMLGDYMDKEPTKVNARKYRSFFLLQKIILKLTGKDKPYLDTRGCHSSGY